MGSPVVRRNTAVLRQQFSEKTMSKDRTPINTNSLTEDMLLDGRVKLAQPVDGLRTAIDAVLLAASVPVKAGQHVLDLGCGAGAVSLCLASRAPRCAIVAVDIEPSLTDCAASNFANNGMADRVVAACADILSLPFAPGSFDQVAMNPPYFQAGLASEPKGRLRRLASIEGAAVLSDWITTAMLQARTSGCVTIVHRADRLDEVIAGFTRHQIGGLKATPIWSKHGASASRVIVQCRKGDRRPFELSPGIVMHNREGRYTTAASHVLRDGWALEDAISTL